MIYDYSSTSGLPFEQQVISNFTPELQWSANFQISFVFRGSLRIRYNNQSRLFRTHDIFFFPPFVTYSFIDASPSTRILTIQIAFDYIASICPDVRRITMQRHHVISDITNSVYCRLCADFAVLIFNNMKNDLSAKLKLLPAVHDMLISLFDNYGMTISSSAPADYSARRINDILLYINANYMEKLTVHEIASSLGIHPKYFSSFFQKNFHVSFPEYLNTFRVNHSLTELTHTGHSILEIALANGFSSHRTYSSAFRKLYGVSPTEYRRSSAALTETEGAGVSSKNSESDEGMFSFFRQFLQADRPSQAAGSTFQNQHSLNFDVFALRKNAVPIEQERFISLGRAYSCLKSDIQEQIRSAKKDHAFHHLRIRDIFSDDLYIYYEKENNEPIYSWSSLDSVFDFILSIGAKPFPEIGYMPTALASKKQYANWQYHPNVSYPKSITKWKELIRAFLIHCLDRYGQDELHSWYFDFWTDPDLQIKNPFWNENMEAFFEFYLATWQIFHEVDPALRLGSPNFSSINGFPWYDAFFQFCGKHQIRPSYISAHLYGCEGHFSQDLNQGRNNYTVADPLLLPRQIETLQEIMERHNFAETKIIVSDWNLTFLPNDLIRDTCYMGPYICHSVNKTLNHVYGLSFWSLSDNFEDFFPDSRLFQGGAGLIDFYNLKKAAYNALSLVGMLGPQLLSQGDDYIFTRSDNEYQLLIYNLPEFDYMYSVMDQSVIDETHRYNIYSNAENHLFHIAVKLPKGTYYIKKYEVNREHGSSYDIWGQMGYPPVLTKDMEDYIRTASIPHISYLYQNIEQVLFLDETVPAHGVMLLKIISK